MQAPSYDPSVIEQFATKLYARARTIALNYGVLGALIGILMAGAMSVGTRGQGINGVILTLVIAIPALIGVSIGVSRGFTLRLQAQQALCQVAIERNTFALRGLLASEARR